MSAINVNKNNFNQEVLNSDKPVLMDFWAPWCGPCRMQSPVVETVAESMPEVKFNKMDVDQNPATAQEFGIMAIPTLLVKKDGEVVERLTGFTPAHQLEAILAKYA